MLQQFLYCQETTHKTHSRGSRWPIATMSKQIEYIFSNIISNEYTCTSVVVFEWHIVCILILYLLDNLAVDFLSQS